jgi:Xaa-Pro aminopeptidase
MGEQLIHRTGHGTGTTTHEPPVHDDNTDRALQLVE